MSSATATRPFGDMLRDWRRRRRLSQLELALEADVSTRHLSFMETGRATPSREMILRLAEELDVPLRERNHLLIAAGYAPVYPQRPIEAPEMAPVREALNKVLDGHEPYPALVLDRHWNIVMANDAAMIFTDGVDEEQLRPPINVNRLCLHPRGLSGRILNLPELRPQLLRRLSRQISLTGDEQLAEQYEELAAYGPDGGAGEPAQDIVWSLRLRSGDRVLSFFHTIATFGTPIDVTLAELAIESFYPADAETAGQLANRSGRGGSARPGRPSPAGS